jgi:hypothetical protein
MVEQPSVSPSLSFVGWSFGQWVLGNGKTIKELLKVGIPFIVGWWSTASPAWTGLITLAGKFILDVADFYLTSVQLKK